MDGQTATCELAAQRGSGEELCQLYYRHSCVGQEVTRLLLGAVGWARRGERRGSGGCSLLAHCVLACPTHSSVLEPTCSVQMKQQGRGESG
mmetsp:Transcript_4538/g.10546  ORF Transcript_4538/g.10546 Transcript_4538/m.10546 type:complete len:91 (-) Transcript_4538:105-377(-)